MTCLEAGRLSDEVLVSRIAEGDVQAFEAVYDRYRSQAFGLALRITGRHNAAEEVTQDAFMNLWRSAPEYDHARASLRAWLLSFVRYRGIDALRRGARHRRNVVLDRTLGECLEAAERTEDLVEARHESRHTRALLSDLPPDQRRVIELAYFNGLTHAEIAGITGVPLGTVKGRTRLALAKMRDALAGDSGLASSG